jgi:hypothetical protein
VEGRYFRWNGLLPIPAEISAFPIATGQRGDKNASINTGELV